MNIRHVSHDSPIGPLRLAASEAGLVAVHMARQRHVPDEPAPHWSALSTVDAPQADILDETRRQLDDYFAGRSTRFDLPLALLGTPFQRAVWEGLRTIEYGRTISYRELAGRIGNPAAVRAVGLANGRNPVSIVVPCHRVIGADGSMTGYGGGIERKVFLLQHEARCMGASPPEQLALA
jgi:methylated-DNA-[protein]-cysteine S-methyltransferase